MAYGWGLWRFHLGARDGEVASWEGSGIGRRAWTGNGMEREGSEGRVRRRVACCLGDALGSHT
jgi:hypothetical protein